MSVLEQFNLAGKTALITGGAGLYGRQMVEALAEAGAAVFMASRNLEQQEACAASLRQRGLNVTAAQLDQSDEQSIQALKTQIDQTSGKLDVLINNAVLRPMADWSSSVDTFEKSMSVNATGIFMMTRVFGDWMAEHQSGSIVNVGSIYGMVGPNLSMYEGLGWTSPPDYYFHKGGMTQFTRYAAAILGPKNVRVNTISPGGFFADQEAVFVERYNKSTFLNRMANNEDLKGTIVFLASDASAYITGANIPVDGGYTAK